MQKNQITCKQDLQSWIKLSVPLENDWKFIEVENTTSVNSHQFFIMSLISYVVPLYAKML